MGKAEKITLGGVFVIAVVVGLLDWVWYDDGISGNTISSVMNPLAWAAALAGFGGGHLWTPRRTTVSGKPSTWAGIILAAALTTAAGSFLPPLAALCGGIASGAVFWPNSRKT